MNEIMCPICQGTGKCLDWFMSDEKGVCQKCMGAGRIPLPDVSDEESQTVLAVLETIRPDLVAEMFTDSVISRMGLEGSEFNGSDQEWWFLSALQSVLLGIAENAWDVLYDIGEACSTNNRGKDFAEYCAQRDAKASRQAPVRKTKTVTPVYHCTGMVYEQTRF